MAIKTKKHNLITFILLAFTIMLSIGCDLEASTKELQEKPVENTLAAPGDDLQAILDSGNNLLLQKSAVYDIKKTLEYKFPKQTIKTKDAVTISDYATLRIAAPDLMQLINGAHQDDIVLENIIFDGNRYSLSIVAKSEKTGGGGQPPMLFFGGDGAEGQKVLNNVFMSTRTWSTLKVHEGAQNILVEGNIFLGAGVDPRGNGREKSEIPFNWGDAVSCAAKNSIVRNNLIIDPTDVGVVFYGAPGSIAENNVISCISRESLGGINLVDGFLYPLNEDEKKPRYDYRGTIVRNNYIDAFGSRIHIAIPMGPGIWVPATKHKTLVGATVNGNTIAGGAAAYGLMVSGVDSFSVYDNKSIANYSGRAEGLSPQLPPDEPAAFLYDPQRTANCKLQKEFVACERHLLHLLRCNHGKTNDLGYRIYKYGKYEVRAVVNSAYLEMLRREPTQKEMEDTISHLQNTQSNADQLRRDLMKTEEFIGKFGEIAPDQLHPYRIKLWMGIFDNIQRDQMSKNGKLPDAKELYLTALASLDRKEYPRVDASTLNKKVMCGYQGWYRCPGDGRGLSWVHYRARNLLFWDGQCGIDFWPDMAEMDQDEEFMPHRFKHADASPVYVYSNANPKSTLRHFKWMRDYGISGVFIQRFAMEIANKQDQEALYSRTGYNHVLNLCREGANRYGRTYTIMYDLSSMPANHIDKIINDWKYLVDVMGITRNPDDKAYQHHNGKPVVGIWGLGFPDGRKYTIEECGKLIDFLKNDPKYGGCTVLVGVPTYWRTSDRDTSPDTRWLDVYRKADIISPWTVGRYGNDEQAKNYAANVATQDIKWCEDNNMEFMPVVFPGFSCVNLIGHQGITPRRDGRFLWTQYQKAIESGATMVYQAMFDELDEGTQIYKVSNTPPVGESKFRTYDGLPTDHYLWLVGEAEKMLNGQAPVSDRIPARKGYDEVNKRIRDGYSQGK